jgi:hypothetical protein
MEKQNSQEVKSNIEKIVSLNKIRHALKKYHKEIGYLEAESSLLDKRLDLIENKTNIHSKAEQNNLNKEKEKVNAEKLEKLENIEIAKKKAKEATEAITAFNMNISTIDTSIDEQISILINNTFPKELRQEIEVKLKKEEISEEDLLAKISRYDNSIKKDNKVFENIVSILDKLINEISQAISTIGELLNELENNTQTQIEQQANSKVDETNSNKVKKESEQPISSPNPADIFSSDDALIEMAMSGADLDLPQDFENDLDLPQESNYENMNDIESLFDMAVENDNVQANKIKRD